MRKNQLGITCIFELEVFNEKNEVTFSTGKFSNTVLNNGLLKLFDYSLSDMCKYVNVGTSGTSVSSSQTGLVNRSYSTNTVFNSQEGAYYSYYPVYRGYKRVIQFNVGTCTGEFLEIGLSRLNNSDYFNRQRIKNSLNQLVLVKVKADEGLRITCDLRICPPPETKVYPQILKLNLNGSTAGNITFSNGTTTRTLTYAQLTTADTAKLELENLFGISKLANYVYVDPWYYILAHPMNTESLNLSIQSHTMTGGTGDPTLVVTQPFSALGEINKFNFQDITLGQTVELTLNNFWQLYTSGINLNTMKLSAVSGNQFTGWSDVDGDNLTTIPFKNLLPRVLTAAGTLPLPTFNQVTKLPALGDSSVTIRCYYAPGALGTGTQTVTAITLYRANSAYPLVILNKFSSPIAVTATEEFEFYLTLSWGRITES